MDAVLGDFARAAAYFERHLLLARRVGDRQGAGNAAWNLALDELGRRAEAVKLARQALLVREAIADRRTEKVRQRLREWERDGRT